MPCPNQKRALVGGLTVPGQSVDDCYSRCARDSAAIAQPQTRTLTQIKTQALSRLSEPPRDRGRLRNKFQPKPPNPGKTSKSRPWLDPKTRSQTKLHGGCQSHLNADSPCWLSPFPTCVSPILFNSDPMNGIEPLVNPYLWAIGDGALDLVPGTEIAGRYRVVAPQVWLDTQPSQAVEHPEDIHRELLPYLYLYPHRLHLPVIYDVCPLEDYEAPVLLLENVPLEGAGSLQPRLVERLSQATSLRQASWFWQLLDLWLPLSEMGVAASLLVEDNLRVEGRRLRLRELYAAMGKDKPLGFGLAKQRYQGEVPLPTLHQLGERWSEWAAGSHPEIRAELLAIGTQLQAPIADMAAIRQRMNLLLLKQSSQFPLRMQSAGQTDPGPQHRQNEDTCYPLPSDLKNRGVVPDSQLIPHLSIVCDGIGGHEGGEVASQMAVRSLKLQMQAFLGEFSQSTTPILPEVIAEQLAASVRVANNLISSQNDAQSRSSRQRMGTTLVMTVHVRQPLVPDAPRPMRSTWSTWATAAPTGSPSATARA